MSRHFPVIVNTIANSCLQIPILIPQYESNVFVCKTPIPFIILANSFVERNELGGVAQLRASGAQFPM